MLSLILPLDILPPILDHLTDRKALNSCSLVSRMFYHAATPLLYRTLDSRIASKVLLFHPSKTLLKRPDLALHVRHVRETGAIHGTLLGRYPNITNETLSALRLCKNLESMTWVDDDVTTDAILLAFLAVLRRLPIRQLTIRTYSDLGEHVWTQLRSFTGLRKVSIWCMEGPPRVLQGWSESLGNTLTHLELGRCSGVPATILISVLSHLPLLEVLRLKGTPSAAIPTILTYLPNLLTLDAEYLGSGIYRQPNPNRLPPLRQLTVRTCSMDTSGPEHLWRWILRLLPRPSLEALTLHAFSMHGYICIPRRFLLDLAAVHHSTLRQLNMSTTQLTLEDLMCVCSLFPCLEELMCCVSSPDAHAIGRAIASARNLRTMQLQVQWIPLETRAANYSPNYDDFAYFTVRHATEMMLRKGSRLRIIGVGPVLYTGKWVLRHEEGSPGLAFEVTTDVVGDRWL